MVPDGKGAPHIASSVQKSVVSGSTVYPYPSARIMVPNVYPLPPGEYDVTIYFNSDENWYMRTRKRPRQNEYSFLSACIHEFQHAMFYDIDMQIKKAEDDYGNSIIHFGKLAIYESIPDGSVFSTFHQIMAFRTKDGEFCPITMLL